MMTCIPKQALRLLHRFFAQSSFQRLMALIPGVACLILTVAVGAQTTIHVDDSAPAGGDGSTWNIAFTHLQDALTAAGSATPPVTIRVGQGTYYPDRDAVNPTGDADQSRSFSLMNGVEIVGGYAGFGAADPDEQDADAFPSILSGDLLQDDGPDFTNRGDNSLHVVVGSGVDDTAVLRSLSIVRGGADNPGNDGLGGGVLLLDADALIDECVFEESLAINGGGAVAVRNASQPVLSACRFENNLSSAGGGLDSFESTVTLSNCDFIDNTAISSRGGAVNHREDAITATDCLFQGNDSSTNGGAWSGIDASPVIEGCTFLMNESGGAGGAIRFSGLSTPEIRDCAFDSNIATGDGGGLAVVFFSVPLVEQCTFVNNQAENGGAVTSNGFADVTYINCRLTGNSASVDGGATFFSETSTTLMANCLIAENTAAGSGGGVNTRYDATTTLTNCTLANNTATAGDGGGVWTRDTTFITLRNTIIWANIDSGGPAQSAQVATEASAPVIAFSCIEGWDGSLGGPGNIGSDPQFVNAGSGDYHLVAASDCVDAGNDNFIPNGVTTDLDQTARITGPDVDMGAYEYRCAANVTGGPAVVDVFDLLAVLDAWGSCPDPCLPACPEDTDLSCAVDVFDLLEVLDAWGDCP